MYGILIVDDNSLVRMSLVNLISWKQHNATLVAIAHDGNEAFRLCEERLPHIVITDIKMPGCDGITLMQKIHRYYPMIQVIAISAHGVFEYAKQAMQAGCLNYILKPISGEELNESIASAIAVIQSRGGRTDEDLYNLYEYALNSYLSSTEKYCAVFLAGWELPTTEEIESICATKYSGQILKAPTQYFQTFLLIFEKNDVLDNLKKITNALVARDGCRYVIEPIPEAVLIDEVGSYFVGIKKKVALTAFWAGNLVVHDERFILEKLEDEVKIYWSLIDYQGMANALMKRLDRSDIRDFSAMRKNKKLIEDYLRLLMTICLSRFDEVCELMVYRIISALGVYNTRMAGFLLYIGTDIIAIYIFLQQLSTIPVSLDEAAIIDGASYFTVYRRIILPLLRPAITTIVIIKGVGIYNDFYIPYQYMPKNSLRVVATTLFQFKGQYGTQWEVICAGAIITVIPILIIFILLQKQIYNGLIQGSIK